MKNNTAQKPTLARLHKLTTLTRKQANNILCAIAEASFDIPVQDVTAQQWDSLTDAHLKYEISVEKQDQQ